MATSRTIICGICEAQYITKHADQWCPECNEGLCSECENNFNNISKATREHGVISIENYHKLPSFISEIANHCEYHDMKYTHFVSTMTHNAVQIVFQQTTNIVLDFCLYVK
jgi:hypothetical protein